MLRVSERRYSKALNVSKYFARYSTNNLLQTTRYVVYLRVYGTPINSGSSGTFKSRVSANNLDECPVYFRKYYFSTTL